MSPRRSKPQHTVTVTIAGEKHVLRSDAAPEYTRSVAAHVDSTVRSLGDAQPLQPHRTAILAALFITDELFRTREELRRLREELDDRAAALTERLQGAATWSASESLGGEGEPPPPDS